MTDVAVSLRSAPLDFLHWWLGELRGLVPDRLKQDGERARQALILEVDADETLLTAKTPKGAKALARIGPAGRDEVDAALASLRHRRYRRWPVIVRLAPVLGMKKSVYLPLAAREDLGSLLHYELDRLTPFSPDDVCFAWNVIETDQAGGRMTVALEMAPKSVVARALDLVAEAGRRVDRVEIDDAGEGRPLNLLPGDVRPAKSGGWLRPILPLLVLVLAIIAVWIPESRQQRMLDRLEREVETLRAEAETILALRERIDEKAEGAAFLIDAKSGHASTTEVLAELTRLIPDHSHILQLDISDGEVQLVGFADKASDLIAIFDRSLMFRSPEFRAAVTRDPRLGKERFQIAVEIAGRSP